MNVSDAVLSRRTIREFLDEPVDKVVIKNVLELAQRSPSGGNLQPWKAVVLSGTPLKELIESVKVKLPDGPDSQSPEYEIYPEECTEIYDSRRFEVAEAGYQALGIERSDKFGRLKQASRNFVAFGAPVLLCCYTPKYMGPPQWADIGMWLQTIMLLLREHGLDSCPQESWSIYGNEVRQAAGIDDEHIFFCALAIGYRDVNAPINQFVVPRAPMSEVVTYKGF